MLTDRFSDEIETEDVFISMDGATAHATTDVMHPIFKNQITSKNVNAPCLSLSCNLTPLDYYLKKGEG